MKILSKQNIKVDFKKCLIHIFRYNLDPFDEFNDEQCITLLESVNCPMPLDRVIDAGEISVGIHINK